MRTRFIPLLIFALSIATQAADNIPLRDFDHLAYPQPTETVYLTQTRVAIADYKLLQQDFPELRGKSKRAIDTWLLNEASYMSATQLHPQDPRPIMTPIPHDAKRMRSCYRPSNYGRALVSPITSLQGLLDIKGCGSRNPYSGSHSNGLASLPEAIQEFMLEKIVNKILRINGGIFTTVGTYAVLTLGFAITDAAILGEGEKQLPAGFIVRQAHRRLISCPDYALKRAADVRIEKILHRYGVTSAGENLLDYLPKHGYYQTTNIQTASNGAIIDFGTYVILPRFTFNISIGGSIAMEVGTPSDVQPEPELFTAIQHWRAEVIKGRWVDHMWIWAANWAEMITLHPFTRARLQREVEHYLANMERAWVRKL